MRADSAPLCETAAGCPIEDLAADPILEELCSKFVKLRGLFEISKSEAIYKRIMAEFGFDEDIDFHIEVEGIYLQWMNKQNEKTKHSMKPAIRMR